MNSHLPAVALLAPFIIGSLALLIGISSNCSTNRLVRCSMMAGSGIAFLALTVAGMWAINGIFVE